MLLFMAIFCICQIVKSDKGIVPVFMLDYDGVMANLHTQQNPFSKLSTSQFSDIVKETVSKSEIVIIFVEEQLSAEDVSVKDHLGTPYHHLREGIQVKKIKYFPAVLEPFKLLHQIFQPQHYNVFHLSTGKDLHIFDGHFKYFYVLFHDEKNETRSETLRRHDLIMNEVYMAMHQISPGTIVAFYTGKLNPVQMEKLSFVPISPLSGTLKEPGVKLHTDGAIYRFVDVYLASHTRRAKYTQAPYVTEQWTSISLETKFSYPEFEVEFDFTRRSDGWTLDSARIIEGQEVVGRTELNVGAPWGMGYYCAEPIMIRNRRDNSYFIISEYQIQPRRKPILRDPDEETPPSGGFGEVVNCSPYFNVPILASLMVTAICLSILMFGFASLYDIRSNDRYEDPHAKPLVIAVEL